MIGEEIVQKTPEELFEIYYSSLKQLLDDLNAEVWDVHLYNDLQDKNYLKERHTWEMFQKYVKEHNKPTNKDYLKERGIVQEEPKIEEFLFDTGQKKKDGTIVQAVNIDKISDYLINKHNFKTIFGKNGESIFKYEKGIFTNDGRGLIKSECERILKVWAKNSVVNEVFEKVKRKTKVENNYFDGLDIYLIPLRNGVYNLRTKSLEEHSPNNKFTFFSPIDYDRNARCYKFLEFVNQTFYEEHIPVIQEWVGFQFYREYFLKKGMILVGQKDTGKTIFLDTLIALIGESNKTSIPLQKVSGQNDFTKLSLKGKLANIYDDLSSKDLSDGGGFKMATGGGWIAGEEKFGDYQQFKSYAKQLFATNKIPPVKDNDDEAYYSRWLPIPCDNTPEKKNPFLRAELSTEKEKAGIFNWAMEGLDRLLQNGRFSFNKTEQEVKSLMEASGSPLVAFSIECLEESPGQVVTKDYMFQIYSEWCKKSNKPRLTKENLGRQLAKYCPYILSVKQKERVWSNVKIKPEFTKIIPNTDTSDTFQKTLIVNREEVKYTSNNIDMYKKEVSELPKINEINFEDLDL